MCLNEAGDVMLPIHEGAITAAHIHADLGEIVTGTKPGVTGTKPGAHVAGADHVLQVERAGDSGCRDGVAGL